ncbi:flavin reductase family protein [Chromobacterium sphagni]|uniref:flavin reductase family protein n=1 Tax=Chromobacterium sphagni TaxID=1903179 RepID=UPI00240A5B99|nr:flavin reductase [Chromobacterium sphagni]
MLSAGSDSGRERNKFSVSGLQPQPAQRVGAPRVADCLAYLECKVVPEPHNQQRYDLFIGEVVAAQADDGVFRDGRWHFSDDVRRSLHYIAGGAFFATGEAFSVV